jgi:hypothetical protein
MGQIVRDFLDLSTARTAIWYLPKKPVWKEIIFFGKQKQPVRGRI